MEFYANEGKQVCIDVEGNWYMRHAIHIQTCIRDRPYLAQREQAVIVSQMVRVFGIGEGAAEEKIRDLTQGANPTVATYAKENEMFVRVTAKAGSCLLYTSRCV